ncbi:MAG TPA: hypothetical protein VHO48_09505, partial [Anaerolineaceae bacterium]|nr:hypothetical protein [Anaerolineaceae bacterium]
MKHGMYGFRKKTTWLIFASINLIFVLWLSYITKRLFAMGLETKVFGVPGLVAQLTLAFFAVAGMFGLYRFLGRQTIQKFLDHRYFPILIFGTALIPRLIWLFGFGPVHLFSDYQLYMDLASSIAVSGHIPEANRWYVSFAPYVLGYASFLAILFTLFGKSVLVAQLANVVFSGAIAVFLFLIGRKISGKAEIGVLAAGIFILFPSQIAINLFPGTEVPFMALMVAALYVCLLIPNHRTRTPVFILLFSAIVLTILMNEIRPLGILILAAFCGFFVFINRFTRRTIVSKSVIMIIFLAAYFVTGTVSANIKDRFLGIPVARNAYGFGLFLGLNESTLGRWSPEDSALSGNAETLNVPAQQFHREMLSLSIQRFRDLVDRQTVLQLFKNKVAVFWTDPYVFLDWTPLMVADTLQTKRILKVSELITTSLYIV